MTKYNDEMHGQHDGDYHRLNDGNGWKVYWVIKTCTRYPEGCVPRTFGNVASHGSLGYYRDGGVIPYSMLTS